MDSRILLNNELNNECDVSENLVATGNNSSRLESIRPPPPLPDLPPPVRKDPGMDAARQEFEYGHGSVQPPGFAESGDFRDRNEFMQRQVCCP